MIFLQVIFWICIFAVLHTYVFYPAFLGIIGKGRELTSTKYSVNDLPKISIVIAAYNEEEVIYDKLYSIINSSYNKANIEILLGSDGSTDRTDAIVADISKAHPFVKLYRQDRGGKTNMLNYLTPKCSFDIIVYTDANVLFSKDMLVNLISRFKDPDIGLVGANIKTVKHLNEGISYQEEQYVARENMLKYREGVLWGAMIGAFGACYAMRKDLYSQIPSNFIVDDFFLNMKVLDSGYACVLDIDAVSYEEVSTEVSEEFRRKVRMSSGNFQNLVHFAPMLLRSKASIGFAFLSHKILRWITPIMLIITLILSIVLINQHYIYWLAFISQILLLVIAVFNPFLRRLGLKSKLLQFVSYFYSMNLALLIGMMKFFSGISSSIWEPTRRL